MFDIDTLDDGMTSNRGAVAVGRCVQVFDWSEEHNATKPQPPKSLDEVYLRSSGAGQLRRGGCLE